MCGLAGFIQASPSSADVLNSILSRMTDAIVHRGPDDSGLWSNTEYGVALGHRRLSIVDLSPEGHQPMVSASGRYVIAFNGEIYNYPSIREELEKSSARPKWRGHSDTEVMLAAFEQWGISGSLTRFVGMFAFALWDKRDRTLLLARDRLGEKPLYYGWVGSAFLFGSELKALRAFPGWKGEINRDALALSLRHSYIPTPYSIYQGIFKLPAATTLTIPADATPGKLFDPAPYWSAKTVAEYGLANRLECSDPEAVDQLDSLLREMVRQQMVADVPLGAFLSGGIDSSTIVALMQAQSDRPVKTFTIGFHEQGYDEAQHAKAVARHLGTDHTELYVTSQQAMDVIPRLPAMFDEPFADSSQIPTYLVSQLARQHVTVSLSGDAGDELFGGYNRYFWARSIWNRLKLLPMPLRSVMSTGLQSVSPTAWDKVYKSAAFLLPPRLRQKHLGDKVHKLAQILESNQPEDVYYNLVSHWRDPSQVVLNGRETKTGLTDNSQWAALPDFTERFMFLDTITYLPDDILVKVDRASMNVSLESRAPFLDHRLLEFAWRLPLSMKIRDGKGKWILRQVLDRYVPKQLIERPKMGFGVPLDSWLRGPLRDWAEALLDERRLKNEGYFNSDPIRKKWAEHLSGQRNWQYHLWDVLMFQAWLDESKCVRG